MAQSDKPKIALIEDSDECYDTKTGKAVPFYTYNPEDYPRKSIRQRGAVDATLEQLVSLCDQDAENVNAHDYCGAHRLLGSLLIHKLGRKSATEIMLDIANRRGLHGMNGLCGLRDSYEDLDVGESGRDWDGKYPK